MKQAIKNSDQADESLTIIKSAKTKTEIESRRKKILKRLSPFLLLTIFLNLLWFPYLLLIDDENVHHITLKLILIPCITAYIIFTDLALWNYFRVEKKVLIWIIEIIISTGIIYLLT